MTRRIALVVIVCAAAAAVLAYLRDPAWLIDQTSGLRRWEQRPGGPRYRWSGAHASFFVPADAGAFDMPVSTTFDRPGDPPMLVTVTVDDVVAARAILTDASWTRIHVVLPPAGRRKVRRVDVRTNVVRDDNHGVRIGQLEFPPRVADKLLRSRVGGETT